MTKPEGSSKEGGKKGGREGKRKPLTMPLGSMCKPWVWMVVVFGQCSV